MDSEKSNSDLYWTSFLGKTGWQKGGWYEKNLFFAIFDPTWTHILTSKAQIRNFLNNILVRKPGIVSLSILWL